MDKGTLPVDYEYFRDYDFDINKIDDEITKILMAWGKNNDAILITTPPGHKGFFYDMLKKGSS